jgi:hypothetical protein
VPSRRQHEAARARGKKFYDELLAAQGGCCAICGRAPYARKFCVDHDHATLQVRGLICFLCNYFVVKAGNKPELLEAAAAYLRNPPAPAVLDRLEGGGS